MWPRGYLRFVSHRHAAAVCSPRCAGYHSPCITPRKGPLRDPPAVRRQVQDDPRDEPRHGPSYYHHDWCGCDACAQWRDCYCGDPHCTGHRAPTDLVVEVTRRTPPLRRPLGPLLRAA